MPKKSTPARSSAAAAKKTAEPKKHVGDVLGISRARVPADVPRATQDRGGNPRGIELSRPSAASKRVRVVGGVRARGH